MRFALRSPRRPSGPSGCQSSSATGIATRALKIVGGDVIAGDVLHCLAGILRVSTPQRGSQIRVRNQIRASNRVLNATMPCSVISTDRPCGRRRIQSRSKARFASDAPTRPAKCGRRSLQSRQGRQKVRRLRGGDVRSVPRPIRNFSPSAVSSVTTFRQQSNRSRHRQFDRQRTKSAEPSLNGWR